MSKRFDDVVIAAHADQALAMLDEPTPEERRVLGAFRYSRNTAVLHSDHRLMPRRRAVWSSWNYIGGGGDSDENCPTVTYWMNSLQCIPHDTLLFVTLNPQREPRTRRGTARSTTIRCSIPRRSRRNGSCGRCRAAATPGSAAPISAPASTKTACRPASPSPRRSGGVRRPWRVANESGRIGLDRATPPTARELAA